MSRHPHSTQDWYHSPTPATVCAKEKHSKVFMRVHSCPFDDLEKTNYFFFLSLTNSRTKLSRMTTWFDEKTKRKRVYDSFSVISSFINIQNTGWGFCSVNHRPTKKPKTTNRMWQTFTRPFYPNITSPRRKWNPTQEELHGNGSTFWNYLYFVITRSQDVVDENTSLPLGEV